jgi:hypothetical protein
LLFYFTRGNKTLDIMNMIAGAATPAMTAKVAGALGLPEAAVRKAMTAGIPVILATLLKRGSTAGGMDAISAAFGGMGKNPLDGLGAALGGNASQVSVAAQGGSDMLSSLLGVGAAGGIAKTLASYAGVDEKAAGPLMGILGSTALGGLKSAADREGLDAAGMMRMLDSQKDQIGKAIPAEIGRMLSTAGVLPQAAEVASAARATIPAAVAPAQSGGWMKWALGAVALAALAWLGSQFFGRAPEPAIAAAPAVTTAISALVVDGVDVGASIQDVLGNLTTTLAGVTDTASATAAVQALTEADTTLGGLESAVSSLSGEGRTAFQALITGALPALQSTIDGLLGDGAISGILKPTLDSILARLTTMGS